MKTQIEDAIQGWDGKSIEVIEGVYTRFAKEKNFTGILIDLLDHSVLQNGVTWLIKKYLEDGKALSDEQTSAYYRAAMRLSHWESKLHLLQSMEKLPIGQSEHEEVADFLRLCLMESNKFVRAWAYSGFVVLAKQHAEYDAEAKQMIELAMLEEAPSIKARLKKVVG
ncbi:hypothetical protein [Poriferisphaera sp. WC338]|uniref:hypothetical protein n=1 Tax=Poriferisphaera sp. WC338 TaxID=3425129 RepID=UPI003D81B4C4